MPQTDIFSYPSQLFWLLVIFSTIYWYSLRYVLPYLLSVKRRRWSFMRRSLAIAKSCPSLTYECRSKCRRKSRLRFLFKRIRRHHKIFRSNFRNLRRGVTDRFISQIPHAFALRAHKASIYKQGLFVSLMTVKDDTVLLISFTIFILSLFSYFGESQVPGYTSYTTELKSLLGAGEAQRRIRFQKAIKFQLLPLLSYRKRIRPALRSYIFYMGKTTNLFSASQYSIMSRVLPKSIKAQMLEPRQKRIASTFFPGADAYELLVDVHLSTMDSWILD